MREVLLIGDLASRTGLSIHTINYYIKLGLIAIAGRVERSGFRVFNDQTLRDLERIIELRRAETPIREIVARKRDGVL
jgi:DNA-binding transcriptional MerR regulator